MVANTTKFYGNFYYFIDIKSKMAGKTKVSSNI